MRCQARPCSSLQLQVISHRSCFSLNVLDRSADLCPERPSIWCFQNVQSQDVRCEATIVGVARLTTADFQLRRDRSLRCMLSGRPGSPHNAYFPLASTRDPVSGIWEVWHESWVACDASCAAARIPGCQDIQDAASLPLALRCLHIYLSLSSHLVQSHIPDSPLFLPTLTLSGRWRHFFLGAAGRSTIRRTLLSGTKVNHVRTAISINPPPPSSPCCGRRNVTAGNSRVGLSPSPCHAAEAQRPTAPPH